MTSRERIAQTLAFREPDRPPHFEQMLELHEEAFGLAVGTFLWKSLICIDTISNYMEFSVQLFEDHKKLEDMALDMFERGKLHVERLLDAGIDFLDIASDHAFNQGMFLPPEEFRTLVLPYQKRLTRLVQEHGAWVIMHTDGYLMDAMDMILEIEPNVLQSIDPMAGMDIREQGDCKNESGIH